MTLRIGRGSSGYGSRKPKNEPPKVHKIRQALTDLEIKMMNGIRETDKTIDQYGCERWKWEGKLHREDGAAVIHPKSYPRDEWYRPVVSTTTRKEYWFDGKQYKNIFTDKQWKKLVTKLVVEYVMTS